VNVNDIWTPLFNQTLTLDKSPPNVASHGAKTGFVGQPPIGGQALDVDAITALFQRQGAVMCGEHTDVMTAASQPGT